MEDIVIIVANSEAELYSIAELRGYEIIEECKRPYKSLTLDYTPDIFEVSIDLDTSSPGWIACARYVD